MLATLLLNKDWQPLSWLPLSVISWQSAIKLQIIDKIEVLSYYDDWEVHSPSTTFKVPALAVTKNYYNFNKKLLFNRKNLFLRDLFHCQYCGESFEVSNLTIDHVIPKVKGGKTSWENCVTACVDCNLAKEDKIMKPLSLPFKPEFRHLLEKRKKQKYEIKHPSWQPYLE